LSINTSETDLEWRLLRFRVEHLHHNGYSGRKLLGMFKRRGLTEIAVEPTATYFDDLSVARFIASFDEFEREGVARGIITAEELARWQAGLETAAANGDFFMSLTGIMAAGRKP
jgi:hypothetical protein